MTGSTERSATTRSRKSQSSNPDGVDDAIALDPKRFVNRELSWLAFNRRVLEEASNSVHPLLERLRFLAISASNLDEFFMVRVSGLIEQVEAGETEPSMDGLTPSELLTRITEATAQLTRDQEECWRALRDKLAAEGILVVDRPSLSPADVARLETYFTDRIFATVTPMAIDPEHPFPFIPNLELSLALEVVRQSDKRSFTALVRLPGKLTRFVRLDDSAEGAARFARVEDVIALFADRLFPGCKLGQMGLFRVIRDLDIEFAEEADDLVRVFEAALKKRRLGSVIRLEVDAAMPPVIRDLISRELRVEANEWLSRKKFWGSARSRS